jgi:hypothetical protein
MMVKPALQFALVRNCRSQVACRHAAHPVVQYHPGLSAQPPCCQPPTLAGKPQLKPTPPGKTSNKQLSTNKPPAVGSALYATIQVQHKRANNSRSQRTVADGAATPNNRGDFTACICMAQHARQNTVTTHRMCLTTDSSLLLHNKPLLTYTAALPLSQHQDNCWIPCAKSPHHKPCNCHSKCPDTCRTPP